MRLQQQGFRTLVLPALTIVPLLQPGQSVPLPANYNLVMFVSGLAAQLYFQALEVGQPFMWPDSTVAACVGQSTATQLVGKHHVPKHAVVYPVAESGNDSEALWQVLVPRLAGINRALIVCGAQGRDWLGAQLRASGVHVNRLELYERSPRPLEPAQAKILAAELVSSPAPVVLLTSQQSVQAMVAELSPAGMLQAWLRCRFVAIHPRVAQQLHSVAQRAGMAGAPVVKLCSPNEDAIFQAIVTMASFTERS